MSEQTIFLAALDIADPAERTAYLASACAGDQTLRQQVEALLAAHTRPGEFLDEPAIEQIAKRSHQPGDAALPGEANAERANRGVGQQHKRHLTPTEALGNDSGEDDTLTFLQPSAKPGSLGRLGHYEVLEVLGRGGFAVVVRAIDEVLQRVVAIKVMSAQMAVTSPARIRFLREGRAAAAVRDDHVVKVHAVEEHPRPYLVMEYIPGQTLQQKLDATGPLETAEMLRLAVQIARGLAAAHAQGLIHRDIKPSNILLEPGPETKVKITDFGLARTADDASLTQSGVIAGTPLYMAPEQALGEPIDYRADLFSLGSVLYVMLTGQPPFRAPTTLAVMKCVCEDVPRPIREIIPEAPPWLCELIGKLHAKKPNERFQTAQEVADLLTQPPAGSSTKGWRSYNARPRRRIWFVVAVLLLAVGLTLCLTAKHLTNLGTVLLGLKGGGPAREAKVEDSPKPPDEPAPPNATERWLKKSLVGHEGSVTSVAYSPDGQLLASGDHLGEVRVWNMPDGTRRYILPVVWPAPVVALAFSPDGKFLLTSGGERHCDINIWDMETGRYDGALKGHTQLLIKLSFGPDGKTLISAAGGWDSTIRFWDFAERREVRRIPAPGRPFPELVVASADGKEKAKEKVGVLRHKFQESESVVVSADGNIAAMWTLPKDEGKVFLLGWDGRIVKTFKPAEEPLCFSPNGRLLACRTGGGYVTVFDVNTGQSWSCRHEGVVKGGAFSRDGRFLATHGSDSAVRVLEIFGSTCVLEELWHLGRVGRLAFSPDGLTLATTELNNRRIKLWDVSFLRAIKAPEKTTKARPG